MPKISRTSDSVVRHAAISQRVKELRRRKKINQEDFSNALGLSASAYKSIEQSKTRWGLDHLVNAADILEVPLQRLLPSNEVAGEDAFSAFPELQAALEIGRPAPIFRAVADAMERIERERPTDDLGDPLLNELATHFRSGVGEDLTRLQKAQAWDSMMSVMLRVRLDWGIDPPPTERKKKGRFL